MKKCISLGVAILAMVATFSLVALSTVPLHSACIVLASFVWLGSIVYYVAQKY